MANITPTQAIYEVGLHAAGGYLAARSTSYASPTIGVICGIIQSITSIALRALLASPAMKRIIDDTNEGQIVSHYIVDIASVIAPYALLAAAGSPMRFGPLYLLSFSTACIALCFRIFHRLTAGPDAAPPPYRPV